jgi:hypothetical protein
VEEPSQDTGESEVLHKTFSRQGHHPSCGHFSSHTLYIGNKVYCAGCTGLVLGAVFAVAGSVLYFYFGVFLGNSILGFWVGFFGVTLGLFQHPFYMIFKIEQGMVKTLVNAIFVVSAFLLLASVDQVLRSFEIGLYTLSLILFWIYTRILMSRRSHAQICNICGLQDCQYL